MNQDALDYKLKHWFHGLLGCFEERMIVFHVGTWSKHFSPVGRNGVSYVIFQQISPLPSLSSIGRLSFPTPLMLCHMTCIAQWSMSGYDLNHVKAKFLNVQGWFCLRSGASGFHCEKSMAQTLQLLYLRTLKKKASWADVNPAHSLEHNCCKIPTDPYVRNKYCNCCNNCCFLSQWYCGLLVMQHCHNND